MEHVATLLRHFSLSPQEAELYLLLLEQGSCNVTNLAHFQKKNRAAVYFHLKHLLENGLARETRVGRRAQYAALPPKDLAALLDGWTADFKSLVPELESLQRASTERPLIEVIESVAGFRRIYDEISVLPINSELLILEGKLAVEGELRLLTESEWSSFFQKIASRRILTRAVFTQESMGLPRQDLSDETMRVFRSRLWDLRTLPESSLPLDHLMMIYGNKAGFFIPKNKLLFTLEHPGIVGILRSLFRSIHGFAEPVKGGW